MKKIIALLLVFSIAYLVQARKIKDDFTYEVVSAGVGTEGTELIKVYSYAKNQAAAIEAGKMNAVHAILFKGIPGSNGTYAKPAMVKPEQQVKNEKFFQDFWKSGKYLQFVTLSSDGTVSSRDMLRVGGQYKVGVVYAVSKTALRDYLESNGIIAKLGSIFD